MIQHNTHILLHGLGNLPKVVQNASLPLDQQLRAEQDAAVAHNVHSALNGSIGKGTASAMIQTAQKANNLRDHFSAMFWSVIAPINNVAVMEVKNAYDLLKNEPKLFKQSVKRNAKTAMQRIDQYDDAVCRTMANNLNGDRKQFWLDYSDEHFGKLKTELEIFRQSVLRVLIKFDEPYSDIKTHMVTSHALLNYSVGMFDMYWKKVKEGWNVDIADLFRDARLWYVLSPWLCVVDTLCQSKKPINIDDDPQVRLAFKVIEKKLINIERLSEIGEIALSYNPDVENEVYHNPLNTDGHFRRDFTKCFK